MYTDECQSCCQQLRSSVVEVSSEIEAAFFLIGFGGGYEDFVAAVIKPNPDCQGGDINVGHLIYQLLIEYRRRVPIGAEAVAILTV